MSRRFPWNSCLGGEGSVWHQAYNAHAVLLSQANQAPKEQPCCAQADDFVMCDDCKEKTKDRKALKLHRVPEVLLIMLKRTMYPSTEKDDRHITFPLEARPYSRHVAQQAYNGVCPLSGLMHTRNARLPYTS